MNNPITKIQIPQNLSITPITKDVFQVPVNHKRAISKFLLVNLIGLLVFAILGTVSLMVYEHAYAAKVYPNILLNNQVVGGKTQAELDAILNQISGNYSKIANGYVISPEVTVKGTYEEMGITIDKEATKKAIWQVGHDDGMLNLAHQLLYYSVNPINFDLETNVGQDKLESFINEKVMPLAKSPTDAKIDYVNNQLVIIGGQNGLAINTEDLKNQIQALAATGTNGNVFVETKTIEPEISKISIEGIKSNLEGFIANSITLTAGTKKLTIAPADLFKMIKFTKNGNKIETSVNTGELESYLLKNEKKLVVPKIDKQIVAGSNVVIREGVNGQKINREDARNKLNQTIESSLSGNASVSHSLEIATEEEVFTEQVIDPKTLASASALDAASPTGKSLVVDISEQRLTAFENGQVVNSFLISSGMPNYESPRGSFTLGRRDYSKWYYGTNRDGSTWSYPNTLYNMNITGPYWLHGAYWHNSFGKKKSHGCINVAYTNASWLWDWTSVGTPIAIQN